MIGTKTKIRVARVEQRVTSTWETLSPRIGKGFGSVQHHKHKQYFSENIENKELYPNIWFSPHGKRDRIDTSDTDEFLPGSMEYRGHGRPEQVGGQHQGKQVSVAHNWYRSAGARHI